MLNSIESYITFIYFFIINININQFLFNYKKINKSNKQIKMITINGIYGYQIYIKIEFIIIRIKYYKSYNKNDKYIYSS